MSEKMTFMGVKKAVAVLSLLLVTTSQPVIGENATDERELQGSETDIVEGPYPSQTIAVAASQLPGGGMVWWSSFGRYAFTGPPRSAYGRRTITERFSEDGLLERAVVTNTEHDMFCPGTAHLPDGRIIVTGGNAASTTSFYDPTSNSWSRGPDMLIPRGYHSMTPLHDGSVFTIGGSWSGGSFRKPGEIWRGAPYSRGYWSPKNIWTDDLLTNDADPTKYYRSDNHMWLFEAPNGLIFQAGPSWRMHWFDLAGDGSVWRAGPRGDDTDAMCGNAVMYDIGKILTVGGSLHYEQGQSSNRAYVIDINGDAADVERVGDMQAGRTFHNSIVLPSGEVIVVGGQRHVILFEDTTGVLFAELWSPITKAFTRLYPAFQIARNYHSVGLLMQDGRVFVAGGGLCGRGCPGNHFDFEILTPPYLLTGDGTELAPRPNFVALTPATEVYYPGDKIIVEMDTPVVHTFALIRLGTATHATNNDQRRIPLEAVQADRAKTEFLVSINRNPRVVLPGDYYLFAMNSAGVPSIGRDLRIGVAV